jgi:hypothetical protein
VLDAHRTQHERTMLASTLIARTIHFDIGIHVTGDG